LLQTRRQQLNISLSPVAVRELMETLKLVREAAVLVAIGMLQGFP
jgi:hypothetical protein